MTNPLVKFPEAGDLWEEVEGPGMYVLAVMPRTPGTDPCAIGAAIVILHPKGELLTPASPLWPTEETRKHNVDLIEEAAQMFWDRGERLKAELMRAQVPSVDLSLEFEQVTRMGATARTLRSTKTGEYWQADWKDLTPAGTLHLHQVHACFVRPPVLLTFLGDGEGE